jgi:hypothetical protein
MKIELKVDYPGPPVAIPAGVYDENDPVLDGTAKFLVRAGYAVEVKPSASKATKKEQAK